MASNRITIRIDGHLRQRLEEEASLNAKNESGVVREALEAYFATRPRRETCYDLARRLGFIGSVRNAPADMSTNRKYFKGLGGR